jgi:transcriptional regulator with GAF, ATPase, and Fis domain
MNREAIRQILQVQSFQAGRSFWQAQPVEFVPCKPAISLSELKSNEKELVAAALRETRGKIYGANGAAAILGLKPTTLASKLVRLGLKRDEFIHG